MDKKSKIAAISLIVVVFAVTIAAAEEIGSVRTIPKSVIHKLGVIGRGLAINSSDASDFKLAVIGIATVRVNLLGEEENVTAGLLWLDGEKYKLKNINIGNGSATADVYKNDTKVGSIATSSVTKGDQIVWQGTLNLNGADWNLYIIEIERKIKAEELKDKVSDYCEENPQDSRCQALGSRVRDYCEDNPDDERCQNIFRAYCVNNLDDSRCRHAIKERCEDAPNATICQRLEVKVAKRFCEENPSDERCVRIRQTIARHPLIDEDKLVTICHIPPGNLSAAHTITIGKPALPAHLAHNDTIGPCEDDEDDDETTTTTLQNQTNQTTTTQVTTTVNATTSTSVNATTSTTTNTTTTTSVNSTTTTTANVTTTTTGG